MSTTKGSPVERARAENEEELLLAGKLAKLAEERRILLPKRQAADAALDEAKKVFDAVNKEICQIEADIKELLGITWSDE